MDELWDVELAGGEALSGGEAGLHFDDRGPCGVEWVCVMGHDGAMAEGSRRARTAAAVVDDELMEALLSATRAMVALAARSLAGLDADVTLPQYRALVVLASRGPQRVIDIATELGVTASTGTRMCDRLVRKGLVRRYRTPSDRRAVRLTLTPAGRTLVEEVTFRRRDELAALIAEMPAAWHKPVTKAMRSIADAVGELPQREWWLRWHDPQAS
jgi:DNA-binding MarR family transcriptional regulator